jgi:DNA topoisomerase I
MAPAAVELNRIRHVAAGEPGLRRLGRTRFRYRDERTGSAVQDRATLARIQALAIPPAWTKVWICADERGHIQATGRDAKGRKQYRYHDGFRAGREQAKYANLAEFGRALPALRAAVHRDLDRRGLPAERVVALAVALLERTFVRVGNEEYAVDNGSYGLTTLRARHVAVECGEILLDFNGKSGRRHRVSCTDPRLCRLIRRCQALPGQLLFEYYDEDSGVVPLTSSDVNDYLRAATGLDVTAKTFRTWGATLLAAAGFAALPPPRTIRERQIGIKTVVDRVAAELHNTPAVCRASYIHPVVVASYEDGTLPERWAAAPGRDRRWQLGEERRLLALLAPSIRSRRREQAGQAA